ncbi:MAG TPA: hypothetical protein VGG37_04880 [Opitutaceae bacterium]|jgi:hypothetical protein
MNKTISRAAKLSALLAGALAALPSLGASASKELIYVDPSGVMRWRTSNSEVAMFGANYCLPSASDYRAAGLVHADRRKMIDDDMAHFARMGWDCVRLSFWGDWENCDREGNLVANDHLDLLDYLIFRAKSRDMHMLLSPIVTYSSSWPGPDDPAAQGFSRFYKREELGTNPKAIAAQVNYLRQLLNHVNPYTGIALKDEPYICYVELINEPWQHPQDFAGSVSYINALQDAVRSTGCQKVTFFNLSQDFAMAQAIAASKVDGSSFAWYPTGLVAGHSLHGNFLRTVEAYPPMTPRELTGRPRLVYEFDMPDVMSGYHYPAMARTFRSVGAQSATMFSYDMLATAPYNLGWQTHCLNMVYTPQKAASAIIASQVMRRIPRMAPVGPYPSNTRFGDFRVSYDENLSELVSDDLFYYSNNTASRPPAPRHLRRIVGFGSSPLVQYEGAGLYFLDRLADGAWHLEVYPDSIQVDDPFAPPSPDRLVFRLIRREWPMTVRLPDLGGSFSVKPLNEGNVFEATAKGGAFRIRPGSYLLQAAGRGAGPVPQNLPGVPYTYGIREFICPASPDFPTTVVLHAQPEYPDDKPVTIGVTVAAQEEPERVELRIGAGARSYPMAHLHGYDYAVTLGPGVVPDGRMDFTIAVAGHGPTSLFPKDSPVASLRAAQFTTTLVRPTDPLVILDPAADTRLVSVSRSGESRNRVPDAVDGSAPGAKAYRLAFPSPAMPEDFTASLYVGDRIASRGPRIAAARYLRIRLRAPVAASVMRAALVDEDGTAWSAKVFATTQWSEVVVPVGCLRPGPSAMIPQAYPGTWSYWLQPPANPGALDLARIERLQLSLRRVDFGTISSVDSSAATIDVESVRLGD